MSLVMENTDIRGHKVSSQLHYTKRQMHQTNYNQRNNPDTSTNPKSILGFELTGLLSELHRNLVYI